MNITNTNFNKPGTKVRQEIGSMFFLFSVHSVPRLTCISPKRSGESDVFD